MRKLTLAEYNRFLTTTCTENESEKLHGNSALLAAVHEGQAEEVSSILAAGNLNSKYLKLALDLSATLGLWEMDIKSTQPKAAAITQLLIAAKADPESDFKLCPTEFGRQHVSCGSVIDLAIESHHKELIKTFYNHQPRIKTHNDSVCLYARFWQSCAFPPNQRSLWILWHLFNERVSLNRTNVGYVPLNSECVVAFSLAEMVITKKDVMIFHFLQAVNDLWVNNKRFPVISQLFINLATFVPGINKLIMDYSDDSAKTYNDFTQNLESMIPEQNPLKEEKLPQSSPCPDLIVAAASGKEREVWSLLEKKADPTVSINGNTALIWALKGGTKGHILSATYLLDKLEPEDWVEKEKSESFCAIF